MSDKKIENYFWGYVGKAGVLVALIWGSIQIYNNFFKTVDYQAITKGNHSFYETSPKHNDAYIKSAEYKALVRTIIEKEGSLKNYKLDSLLKSLKTKNSNERLYFDLYLSQEGISTWKYDEYSTIWTFSIKNTGNKPLEDLVLELPFEGYYKVILPNNAIKLNDFKERIEVGDIRPSYEANIFCWTNNSLVFSDDDEEKSRFTHKNGWFGITYPVEVRGLYAWNKKHHDTPLVIGIGLLLFLLIFVFAIGERVGNKKVKQETIEHISKKTESNQEQVI